MAIMSSDSTTPAAAAAAVAAALPNGNPALLQSRAPLAQSAAAAINGGDTAAAVSNGAISNVSVVRKQDQQRWGSGVLPTPATISKKKEGKGEGEDAHTNGRDAAIPVKNGE